MRQKQKHQPTANLAVKPKHGSNLPKVSSFADHIAEFRRRLVWIALVFVAGSGLAYTYHHELTRLIMAPLDGQKLVYLTPGGGFSFIFQVSIYAGLIVAAPFIVHHIYAFIRPALPSRAQRSATKIVISALCLIAMGIAYGYFVAVPAALQFLSGFAGDSVTPNLTADSYLNFFLSYIAGLALLSLLPLFLIFWHWIKPLTPGRLLKSERWVILLAFIAAAIITPTPDAANQTMIAGPVILLYQFGAAGVLVSIARSKRTERLTAKHTVEMVPDEQLDLVLAELQNAHADTAASILPSSANMDQQPGSTSRQYLDVAPATRAHQETPARLQVTTPVPPTTKLPQRSMDIVARQPAQPRPRPTQPYSYVQRPTVRRSQLSLDGIFAPMQTAA
jgi:sec-independent protein translocase protein TatC